MYTKDGKILDYRDYVRYILPSVEITRSVSGSAIDFLKNDIEYYIKFYKFKNPFPINTINLPLGDKPKEPNINASWDYDLYSYSQKITFLKKLYKGFLENYTKIINDNFPRLRNSFYIFKNQPIELSIYTYKYTNSKGKEDLRFICEFNKEKGLDQNNLKFFENIEFEFQHNNNKHLFVETHFSWNYFYRDLIIFSHEVEGYTHTSKIKGLNVLPLIYGYIQRELSEILDAFQDDSIFDEIRPYDTSIENWVQMIIDSEKRGNEDYHIEFKSEPTESANGDGTGNDIYGHINAFENHEGGYLFIGIDESKSGRKKIIGIDTYLNAKNKNLDQLIREIRQKSYNYLGNDYYRIESRQYEDKNLIRIKIPSNNGGLNWFTCRDKNMPPRAYIRKNREKRLLSTKEIEERIRVKLIKKI